MSYMYDSYFNSYRNYLFWVLFLTRFQHLVHESFYVVLLGTRKYDFLNQTFYSRPCLLNQPGPWVKGSQTIRVIVPVLLVIS